MNNNAPSLSGHENGLWPYSPSSPADAERSAIANDEPSLTVRKAPHQSRGACLAAMVLGLVLAGTSLNGAVLFDVAEMTANPSSTVTVPVTVQDFTDVSSFQFSLTWDPAVLTFSSSGDYALPNLDAADFQPSSGRVGITWTGTGGVVSRDDGTTLFSIVFNTSATPGTSSINFSDNPVPREVSVNFSPTTFSESPGMVTVVPEPINVALGIFGGLVAVTAGYRKFRHKLPLPSK